MSSMAKVMQKIREGGGEPSQAEAPPENTDAQAPAQQAGAGDVTSSEELVLKEDGSAAEDPNATQTPADQPENVDDTMDVTSVEPAASESPEDDPTPIVEPSDSDNDTGFVPEPETTNDAFISAADEQIAAAASIPAEPIASAETVDLDEAIDSAAPQNGPLPTIDDAASPWDPQRVDPVIVAFHDRYSAVCEQYRSIRARLMTMNTARTNQVLAVTSSIPEEGKSVTTINLGLIMAEGGEHQVLVADADFRRTSIARMLGVPVGPGLADVLREELPLEEAVQPTPFPNLKILTAGTLRNKDYGDLIGRPTAAGVLGQCRAMFDYTFLDTPPTTTVSDVCLLAPHCDGALMVIEMRRTPEPTVQQAVRTLQANNVKILGCLLSRFRDRGSAYYERYYSNYYR